MHFKISKIIAIKQIKFRSLLGGLVSLLPFGISLHKFCRYIFGKQRKKRPLEYGLNVLLHRLNDAELNKKYLNNKVFLEIAPGDNFSGPIAAVLLGAKKAIGIDAYDYTEFKHNSAIVENHCSCVNIDAARRNRILQDLKSFSKESPSKFFCYFAPYQPNDIFDDSLDVIMSLSTMEHVQKPEQLYQNCYNWLKPGGIMIHKIDFSAHGMCKDWFGHLLLPELLFKIASGKKTFMNRWTEKQHIEACINAGFSLQKRIPFKGAIKAPKPIEDLPVAATHIWIKS